VIVLKILHFNDVANVSSTLVDASLKQGIYSEIYRIPLGNYRRTSTVKKIYLLFNRLVEIIKLRKYYKENNFSILHIHYAYFGILGVLAGIPYHLHCHGTDVRDNLKHPLFKSITLFSLKKAKKVYYSTPDLAEAVNKIRKDALFIPNPINLDLFINRDDKGTTALNDKIKIIVISKLDPTKGIDIVMNAIKKLSNRKDIDFTVFNFGVESSEYIEVLKSYKNIKLIDRVSYMEMPNLVEQHNIVIGQLKLGAIGMSELEAMALGMPVISKFNYDFFYKEPPPFVKVTSSNELVKEIENLVNNPVLREEIGLKSKDWVKRNHDYKTIFDRLLKEYQ